MRYRHCIFDLYGTLVDIRTDEDAPGLWAAMADYYRAQGCDYDAAGLRTAYRRLVRELEKERAPFRREAHEAHPEIQIELVFQRLFQEKGAAAELPQAVQAGRHFRELSTEYIRLYNGVRELLTVLRERGRSIWLLSNAQAIFTRWELDRLQLTDCFDGIYLSSDYGVKKPDRRFFDILLQEQSIPPGTGSDDRQRRRLRYPGGQDGGFGYHLHPFQSFAKGTVPTGRLCFETGRFEKTAGHSDGYDSLTKSARLLPSKNSGFAKERH